MLALVIVEAEPGANASPGLGNADIGVEVDFLVFEASPQSLDKDVVHAAPLAIHADGDLVALQGAGEVVAGELAAPSLRWGRLWSVLKISGRPCRASASSSASTQQSVPSVLCSRHANTPRLTQSMMTTR